jgi:hypothetical protein
MRPGEEVSKMAVARVVIRLSATEGELLEDLVEAHL